MILVFSDSEGEERIVGEYDTYKSAMAAMYQYIKDLNPSYRIPYTRVQFIKSTPFEIFNKCRLQFDVGSHTEFFYLDDLNQETLDKLEKDGLTPPKEETKK